MKINMSGRNSFEWPSPALGHGRAGQGAGLQDRQQIIIKGMLSPTWTAGETSQPPRTVRCVAPGGKRGMWRVNSTALQLSASY